MTRYCGRLIEDETKLTIAGTLSQIATCKHCGYFHFGAVAEYTDLEVVEGDFSQDTIYVIHGCPEMSRNTYAANSGDLEKIEIGARHLLHLAKENVYKIESIVGLNQTYVGDYFVKEVYLITDD